jgi:prepilin-type N-terminal cleavage/methylation domain-containing protein
MKRKASGPKTPGHRQRGMTLVELMIATTVMASLSVFMLSAGQDFSETLVEQQQRTDVYTRANVLRMRLLGDARRASSAICPDSDTLSITLSTDPSTFVEYYVANGDLVRWTLPPDHESLIAEDVQSITCTSLGTDGLFVSVEMGTADHPYHMHVRVSDTGA